MQNNEVELGDAPAATPHRNYADEVVVVRVGGREFVLVGTAHVSRESADLVRAVIVAEAPDRVCIELDPPRFEALSQKQRFESLDVREVIRRQQLVPLIFNLVLASYQKQLGIQLGVQPGTELLEAALVAEEHGVPVSLCDRDVRITLRRAWGALSLWRKAELIGAISASLFETPQLSEEDLRRLRQQDVVSQLMEELGATFPMLKKVLIDERDTYLSAKISAAEGAKVVAVVGAGHLQGIRRALEQPRAVDLATLEEVPPPSRWVKLVGWGIPATIIGAMLWIGWRDGPSAAGYALLYWIFATGFPAMLGAFAAFAHPATSAITFLAAPLTTLSPLIGVGYVAAFAQVYFRPPLVRELREVSSELRIPSRWWGNRLLRIFLVFLLTTIGAVIGTFVGGAEILRDLR